MSWGCDKDHLFILALCIFIALLAFKPSEPYLSQFLICNSETEQVNCNTEKDVDRCVTNEHCHWIENSKCSLIPCFNVTKSQCENMNYCTINEKNQCINIPCYKNFTVNEVNNEIFPWSTYAYLIFLVILMIGPMMKIISFRIAIIFGILGRVATRFLLLYGTSIF